MQTAYVQVNQKGLRALMEIQEIFSDYPKVNRFDYNVQEDVLALELENVLAEKFSKLTIEGVRKNKEVKSVIMLYLKGCLEIP